jgi:uncharacterized protein YjbJ (UPF0337 family)
MNWDIVEGNGKQFRGEVKAQWVKLTDDHLEVISGKRIELAGKILEACGITKEEAEQKIKNSSFATRTTVRSTNPGHATCSSMHTQPGPPRSRIQDGTISAASRGLRRWKHASPVTAWI